MKNFLVCTSLSLAELEMYMYILEPLRGAHSHHIDIKDNQFSQSFGYSTWWRMAVAEWCGTNSEEVYVGT